MNTEDKNWIRKEILVVVLDHIDHAERRISNLINRMEARLLEEMNPVEREARADARFKEHLAEVDRYLHQDPEKRCPWSAPRSAFKGQLQIFNADGSMNRDPLGELEDD